MQMDFSPSRCIFSFLGQCSSKWNLKMHFQNDLLLFEVSCPLLVFEKRGF